MTYRQIQQVEDYLKEVLYLINDVNVTDDQRYNKGKTLHKQIAASKFGYSLVLDWQKCQVLDLSNSPTRYYTNKIKLNLEVMLSALQGILDSVVFYPYILEIRKDIEKGKKIKNGDAKERFVTEITIKYQGKVDFGKNVEKILKNDGLLILNYNIDAIHQGVLQKLELYLLEVCEEKRVIKAQSQSKQPIIQVNQNQNVNQNVNQNQETKVSVSLLFEDCFKAIDDCETLDESETKEIKTQIQEIQELLKDKKGRKKSIKSKIGSVLKWVAEKGSDVMLAVLPVLLQSLQGL